MIPNYLALVPVNHFQRAVALTYSDLSKRSASGATPFANAFFRYAFDTTKPKRQELLLIADNQNDTVPEITVKLDRFLRSNGQQRCLVSTYFAEQAFPSVSTCLKSRSDNHISMKIQRDNRINTKRELARQCKLVELKTEMLALLPKQLTEFISNNDTQWHEHELKQCLRAWYTANVVSEWRFDDLYSELSASRTALDLSFSE
ncbi:hypothetical protein [Vibrio mediterranei]|uniref:hypothetical protein n=1 Tax=Vibrio mediterranei TaxID=689 RepID=UPI0040690A58